MIQTDIRSAEPFLQKKLSLSAAVNALRSVKGESCKGHDFLGWKDLPADMESQIPSILSMAKEIREQADVLVVIGIGGSYLGARAAIEFLQSSYHNEIRQKPQIYFSGINLSGYEAKMMQEITKGKNVYLNVISKSGTTLEPAAAFRIFREQLEKTLGKEAAASHIICTTDSEKGALHAMAQKEGYRCLVIPGNVGGRFSVLSPVGLLPMAAAGIDISALMASAKAAMSDYLSESETNPALLYAATRQALRTEASKTVEILSCTGERFRFLAEWWKQLFGESEGKEGLGIFPASCIYTADLHSMGQYIQDGPRILFETMVRFEKDDSGMTMPYDPDNGDGLNYTAGKSLEYMESCALQGVKEAHVAGGVPVLELLCGKSDLTGLADLFCFFEVACAVSAILEGVNPFDQPGVESYKKNMFRLLGKE